MDAEDMDLAELIQRRRRGRSVEALGRHLGVVGNTVRGWASGKYPMPEFQAPVMAAWLEVPEVVVLAAAEVSRQRAEPKPRADRRPDLSTVSSEDLAAEVLRRMKAGGSVVPLSPATGRPTPEARGMRRVATDRREEPDDAGGTSVDR